MDRNWDLTNGGGSHFDFLGQEGQCEKKSEMNSDHIQNTI
jgi:hypothetical protein